MQPATSDPLAVIDQLDPQDLRQRLGRCLREADALRRLIRLAQRTEKAREDRRAGQGGINEE